MKLKARVVAIVFSLENLISGFLDKLSPDPPEPLSYSILLIPLYPTPSCSALESSAHPPF